MDERFGPFRVLSRIGRGAMAETFVAERVVAGGATERVCLKRMLPIPATEPDVARFFDGEAWLVSTLDHPNIVGLYDYGEERGTKWMALELVEGVDLRTLLNAVRARGERLPIDVAVHIGLEVAKALAHAHALVLSDGRPANVVHRDVAPTNVLLGLDGRVKLSDFGIARSVVSERTRSTYQKGKAPYMAPEQALKNEYDHRADLFALGVILFEMLAGERPYGGRTDLEVLTKIVSGERKSLRALRPDVPPVVAVLTKAMLAPELETRVESAAAVMRALAQVEKRPDVAAELGRMVRSARG